ncbi:MAG: hypothetical protein HUU26_14085 [Gemmatimonadaceae bacterium]|nr:hypothetical protein [Gemmatimonadaceae bacterium]
MAHLSPADWDRLERAVLDGRRIALTRSGRELVVVPLRVFLQAGREAIEARHPTTGHLLVRLIDELDAVEILP